jgi:chaperone modulatory protein CbpM
MMRLTEEEVLAEVREVGIVRLRLWVERGWVVPNRDLAGPTFDELDVARIRLVCQLCDELAVEEDSLPVILSLVDQLYATRRDLKALARAVLQEPEDTRTRIHQHYRAALGP